MIQEHIINHNHGKSPSIAFSIDSRFVDLISIVVSGLGDRRGSSSIGYT